MCQGKMLKAAGLRSLDMCATGTQRKHLAARCHLYSLRLGSLLCVTCSCGAASIWATGEELRAPSSFSTSWTETDETDMSFARKSVCLTVSLPLPLSMTISPEAVVRQRYQLADMLLELMQSAYGLHMVTAKINQDVRAALRQGPPSPPSAIDR